MAKNARRSRQQKSKGMPPAPSACFEIAPIDGLLGNGYYWTMREYKLTRGPFATEEEAEADAMRMGKHLLAVVLVPPVDDEHQAELLARAQRFIDDYASG
jgi:hypothetical protein